MLFYTFLLRFFFIPAHCTEHAARKVRSSSSSSLSLLLSVSSLLSLIGIGRCSGKILLCPLHCEASFNRLYISDIFKTNMMFLLGTTGLGRSSSQRKSSSHQTAAVVVLVRLDFLFPQLGFALGSFTFSGENFLSITNSLLPLACSQLPTQ